MKRDQFFALLVTLVFGVVCLTAILHHEMWRDELDTFVTARDSSSFSSLMDYARFSGHPGLWFVFVYGISRFARNPAAIQLLNLVFALGAIYVFSCFSPFPRWLKVLFAFGYFPLYEYGVISREYCLGMLLVFLLCAVYCWRPQAMLLISLLLVLMAFTTIYTFILGVAFCACLLGRLIWDPVYRSSVWAQPLKNGFAGIAAIAAMVILVVLLRPPSGGRVYHGLNTKVSIPQIEGTMDEIWNAYLPFPKIQREFWNTNLVTDQQGPQPYLELLLMAIAASFLFRNRFALFFYCMGTVGILAFSYLVYHGYLRHHGFLFVLLLASLWISNATSTEVSPGSAKALRGKRKRSLAIKLLALERRGRRHMRFQVAFLAVLLTVHCAAGLFACAVDWIYPFSCNRLAANYILQQHLDSKIIFGRVDFVCFSITAWIKREIYFADSLQLGTYIHYDKPATFASNEIAASMAQITADENGSETVLVLTEDSRYPLPGEFVRAHPGKWNITEAAHFTDSIVPDEHFWIYILRPRPQREIESDLK